MRRDYTGASQRTAIPQRPQFGRIAGRCGRSDGMLTTAEVRVRTEWDYQVRTTCQEFHNRTLAADRFGFEDATRWLARTAPAATTIQEADWLKTMLKDAAVSSAIVFHQRCHRRKTDSPCALSPIEAAHHTWAQHHEDPRVTVERWLAEFMTAFDRAHPTSIAERAAAILRSQFLDPPGLVELARSVGTSRSVLADEFRKEYSLSCGEYLECVRVRHFITQASTSAVALTALGEQSGYRSYKNLVAAVRRRTGLLPQSIRQLPSVECETLCVRVGAPSGGSLVALVSDR
jgi:AraC-like DNA-binding protein